jgi:glycosyltransferase involved in cell wall biosynthesis
MFSNVWHGHNAETSESLFRDVGRGLETLVTTTPGYSGTIRLRIRLYNAKLLQMVGALKAHAARLVCDCWLLVALIISRRKMRFQKKTIPLGASIALFAPNFSANAINAHVRPILEANPENSVSVFACKPIPVAPYVTLVTPSRWLVALIGPVFARTVVSLLWVFRNRPNLIIGMHLPWNGLLALCIARLVGTECWYFCIGGPHELYDGGMHSGHRLFEATGARSRWRERALVALVNRFDLVLTMGSRTRSQLQALGATGHIVPIGAGIDLQRFCSSNEETKNFDIIVVARLAPAKRLNILLQSIALIRKNCGTAPKTLIVGDGPERNMLRSLSVTLSIDREIRFMGWCEDVEFWLRQARVFVLCSSSEALPIALLEAMACGIPAVAPFTGDIQDALEDGASGIVTRLGTVDELAAAIQEILGQDLTHYLRMAHRARSTAAGYGYRSRGLLWRELLENRNRPVCTR